MLEFILGFSGCLLLTCIIAVVANGASIEDDIKVNTRVMSAAVKDVRPHQLSRSFLRAIVFSMDGGALGRAAWRFACAVSMPEETRDTWELFDGPKFSQDMILVKNEKLIDGFRRAQALTEQLLDPNDRFLDRLNALGWCESDKTVMQMYCDIRESLGTRSLERLDRRRSAESHSCI